MSRKITKDFIEFVKENPTIFHVVNAMGEGLEKAGFIKLSEEEEWKLKAGGKYYVTRNDSSIIGFTLPGL